MTIKTCTISPPAAGVALAVLLLVGTSAVRPFPAEAQTGRPTAEGPQVLAASSAPPVAPAPSWGQPETVELLGLGNWLKNLQFLAYHGRSDLNSAPNRF